MTTVFFFECLIKIIVQGLIFNGPNSYLRNSWNVLDFFIVIVSVVSLLAVGVQLNVFKVLRMLRILRPLKMISKNPNLKIAV